jgi:thiamine biosynthesis lipoprotein
MKRILTVFLSLLLLACSGCARTAQNRYSAEFLSLFDTVTTVVGYSDSKGNFTALAEEIKDKLEEYHQLYDIYNDYEGINNIKTINDNAGKAPVVVDSRIIDLLLFAKERDAETGGAVNIAFGAVLSIWHDYREAGLDNPEEAEVPPMEQLLEASQHTDINNVVIDTEAKTVYLNDPQMRLDVGAVAKGYAAEQTALYFEGKGIEHLLLSVGGNVRAIGSKLTETGEDTPWVVSIQNPDKSSPDTELLSLNLTGMSLVSSGNYERYYMVDGVRYHHIIDPETLMPSLYLLNVSILCRDSGKADALSTAIFNMPLEEGRAYIESLEDTEALWVLPDGTIEVSDGFNAYVKPEN